MAHQPTLFDDGLGEESDEKEACIPGVVYRPRFLSRDQQARVWGEVNAMPWQDDLKRKVQHYGYKYDYKARAIDRSMFVGPLPEFAREIAARLVAEHLVEEMPDQMIVNNYEPGQGIALHVDCEPCFGPTIATISLGSEYEMTFKHITSGNVLPKKLELGSALIMSGPARYEWMHGIKPRLSDKWGKRGRRISLTFRKVLLES